MSTTTFPTTEPLTPKLLAERLTFDGCGLEELVRDCEMEAEFLAKILYSREFQDHVQLRVDLAIACAKIRAAQALPDCIEILHDLTESKKPEVARRAAMTILGIVGLPTPPPKPTPAPAATEPVPPPPPAAPPEAPPPIENQKSKTENPPHPDPAITPNPPTLPPLPFPLSPSSPPDFLTSSHPHFHSNTPNINQNPNDSAPFLPPPPPLSPTSPPSPPPPDL